MKIILEQDVAKIGTRGDIVEVANGYAMNQLIPKGMAKPATGSSLKQAEARAQQLATKDAADAEKFTKLAAAIKDTDVTITADVNETGGLFKAISPEEIAAAAQEKGVDIDAAQILVGEPIKETGEHTVELVRGSERHDFTITVAKAE